MKLENIFAHPLLQLVSFSILLVGSAYFGGPYIYFLFHAAQEGYIYGIIGALAIIVTIVAIFYSNRYVQVAGLALMVLSLMVFFIGGKLSNAYTFHQIVPFLTLALFIGVSVAISLKFVRYLKQ
jgi:hypothetical protein